MRKIACMLVFLCCAAAMAADFSGTWKMNLEKSKPINAEITAYTMTFEKTGPNSYRTSIDIVLTSGEKHRVAIDRLYDGQEHAYKSSDVGVPGNSSEICEFVTGGDRKIAFKTDGKVVSTMTSTLSGDGQTLTNVTSSAKGEGVAVFDREK